MSTNMADQPVFSIWLEGYGVRAIPHLPVGVAHLETGTLIFGPTSADQVRAEKNALLTGGNEFKGEIHKQKVEQSTLVKYCADDVGATTLVLGDGVSNFSGVLSEFIAIDVHDPEWAILTDQYGFVFPPGFTLRATGSLEPRTVPFELVAVQAGPNLVRFFGPLAQAQIPHPEDLATEGQELTDQGDLEGMVNTVLWFEVSPEEGTEGTIKRYYYVPFDSQSVVLMKVEAAPEAAEVAFAGGEVIAETLCPNES